MMLFPISPQLTALNPKPRTLNRGFGEGEGEPAPADYAPQKSCFN